MGSPKYGTPEYYEAIRKHDEEMAERDAKIDAEMKAKAQEAARENDK